MKNIKDITISIFAVIGFIALVSGFTNKTEVIDCNVTQLGGKPINFWCSNANCDIVEFVPSQDLNSKLDRVGLELETIQNQMNTLIKQIKHLK